MYSLSCPCWHKQPDLRPTCPVDMARLPVPTVLPRLSCPGWPDTVVLSWLPYTSYPVPFDLVLAILYALSCPDGPVLDDLLGRLSRLTCPDCPFLTVMPRFLGPVVLSSCHVLAVMFCRQLLSVLSRLTCTDWPVRPICPGCPVSDVLSWLSRDSCSVTVILPQLSFFYAAMFWSFSPVSCPCYNIPIVLPDCLLSPIWFRLSCLYQLSCPSCPVLTLFFPPFLSPLSCPCPNAVSILSYLLWTWTWTCTWKLIWTWTRIWTWCWKYNVGMRMPEKSSPASYFYLIFTTSWSVRDRLSRISPLVPRYAFRPGLFYPFPLISTPPPPVAEFQTLSAPGGLTKGELPLIRAALCGAQVMCFHNNTGQLESGGPHFSPYLELRAYDLNVPVGLLPGLSILCDARV